VLCAVLDHRFRFGEPAASAHPPRAVLLLLDE
jgi:hypothetical protein